MRIFSEQQNNPLLPLVYCLACPAISLSSISAAVVTVYQRPTADAKCPVLRLAALNAVHLPGGGPEDGDGSPGEVAAYEAPNTAILTQSLTIVTGHAGGTAVALGGDKG